MAKAQSGSFEAVRVDGSVGGGDAGRFNGSTGPAVGFRGGYWFKGAAWLAAAFELSHFEVEAENSSTEVGFAALSPMLMLRYPLFVGDDFPNGRFFPYAGIGVSLVFADVDSSAVDVPDSTDLDDDSGHGSFFCLGGKWFFNRNVGLFVECRNVSVSFDQSSDWQTGGFFLRRDHYYDAEGDAKAYQFVGGLAVHF